MLKFIHAADFHLDTAFAALPPGQAAERRRESRELAFRLADYVNSRGIQLVLLAGDLFDSAAPYRETGETLAEALGRMKAQVFAAPGNHDWYGPGSPWLTVDWPENIHIFRENAITSVDLPELGVTVHGGAFTGPEQGSSLLSGFSAPEDGRIHLGLLHGEIEPAERRYNPLERGEIAASGLTYLALGHIHKRGEPTRYGQTLCAWPGCVEGRGFDEQGEKGFYEGTAGGGTVSLTFVPFAGRRYETLEVDVTDRSPRAAVEAALPKDTEKDLYRILLTGETGERGAESKALETALAGRFYALEVQDRTRMAADIWARAGEDSLRGLFLRELRAKWDAAADEAERETITQAVRFGLSALDHRDLG
jgi:DNA repair exonuclease SbcCD nuclease subunit